MGATANRRSAAHGRLPSRWRRFSSGRPCRAHAMFYRRAAVASSSSSGTHVRRCPACNARLPIVAGATLVVCEYCDARVELGRGVRTVVPGRQVAPARQSSAWIVVVPIAVVLVGGATAASAWLRAQQIASSTQVTDAPAAVRAPAPVALHAPTPTPTPTPAPTLTPTPTPTPTPAHTHTGPRKPRVELPSGPVITVEEARKQLEPKVRACMGKAGAHHLLAYMGNSTSGPVKLLSDSRTSVDGKKLALAKTSLGKCIDAAGAAVHTAAFKSNYVRLDVRNDDVPDPLGSLPASADMAAVREVLRSSDAAVKACARKHGALGTRDSFRIEIDGPAGKPTLVQSHHDSSGYRRCAEAIYAKARFAKVKASSYSVSYSIEL